MIFHRIHIKGKLTELRQSGRGRRRFRGGRLAVRFLHRSRVFDRKYILKNVLKVPVRECKLSLCRPCYARSKNWANTVVLVLVLRWKKMHKVLMGLGMSVHVCVCVSKDKVRVDIVWFMCTLQCVCVHTSAREWREVKGGEEKKWRAGQYPRFSFGTHYALVMVFATHGRLHSLSLSLYLSLSVASIFSHSGLSPGTKPHTHKQKKNNLRKKVSRGDGLELPHLALEY